MYPTINILNKHAKNQHKSQNSNDECPTCNGWGKVDVEGRVPWNTYVEPCPDCRGSGFN